MIKVLLCQVIFFFSLKVTDIKKTKNQSKNITKGLLTKFYPIMECFWQNI